jgi:hypothetical protein
MKKSLAVFLQILIVLIAIVVFVFMLWEPHLEGRNTHTTVFQIYFQDPFLAYAYVASIPFFVALYHLFKVLGLIEADRGVPSSALKSLRTIKYCAMAMIGLAVLGEIFILSGDSDDRAGGVFMGILVMLGALGMLTGASVLIKRTEERRL